MTGPDPSHVKKSPRKAKKRSRGEAADSSQAKTGNQRAKKSKQSPQAKTGKQRAKKSKQSPQAKTGKQRAKKGRQRPQAKTGKQSSYFWLPDLGLTMEDKMDLQGTEKLDWQVMVAAMQLLRQQFQDANGLPCIRGVLDKVSPTTQPTVQFHGDCQRDHAFVTACDGTKVVVADSYTASAFGTEAIQQIEKSYKNYVKYPIKNMEFLQVDQQSRSSRDCVVHSIANAYELLAADGNTKCVYNKKLLRPHLIQCFINREITEFPKDYKPAGQPLEKPFNWKP